MADRSKPVGERLERMYGRVGRDRDNAPRPIGEDASGRKVFPARPVIYDQDGGAYWVVGTSLMGVPNASV